MRHIPEHELTITFARSSGAGGQNVNKTSTKATVRWSVGKSQVVSTAEKNLVRKKLANRLTWGDEIIISSEEERSQPQNKARAIARLQALVAQALKVSKKRMATKPTLGSKRRRLDSKKRHSQQKKQRREPFS